MKINLTCIIFVLSLAVLISCEEEIKAEVIRQSNSTTSTSGQSFGRAKNAVIDSIHNFTLSIVNLVFSSIQLLTG
ncbi:hypothetical protein CHUAL_008332 [Chamberlinius hualienensis]